MGNTGNAISVLVMLAWLPIVLYLFSRYPPQRAIIISFIVAWLFLPQAVFVLPSIPDWTKISATCYSAIVAILIFDSNRLLSFRPSWIDLPILVLCISPFFSSMTNDLGPYDGLSMTLDQVVTWGLPYFLGRLYICNFEGMRLMAIGIFMGGIIYIPLCLVEARLFMSLHERIYGFITFDFGQALRLGGYRPSVFMTHGLAVGVWMMCACLMGIVLWRSKVIKRLWNVPVSTLTGLLLVVFVFIRSTGAYNLLIGAVLILFTAKWFRTTILVWVVVAIMVVYLNLGVTGQFPKAEILGELSKVFDADRIQSVEFRFDNEEILGIKARQRMIFGWGGFGRNRVFDDYGKDISVTDSLWMIVFGITGLVGLVSLMMTLLLPVLAFCIRFPAQLWSTTLVAPAAGLSAGLLMYAADCILNAMINPIFVFVCGGVAGLVINPHPDRLLKS
jgi:hypothetical protein